MMTQGDFEKIGKLMDNKITNALGDFFEHVLAPYLQGEFNRIDKKLKAHDEEFDDIHRKLDHNRDEHDKMFVRFDQIEKKVDGRDTRIKRIEKTLQTT